MAGKRWHICNVLAVGAETRRLWHFDAKGKTFKLDRELTLRAAEPLPAVVTKSWSSLFQAKLNVACLPPDRVFLRAAIFPNASFQETLAMVDLQMEKLSPMPVGQIVWTIHCLPHPDGQQQTVIVTMASREAVEELLGKLEADGYLADRLELPALDQLLATEVHGDGAWIYPEALGGIDTAMVVWWTGGVLRSIDFLSLPATSDRAAVLCEQLLQMAWAGEIEGWLTTAPSWHLVASPGAAPTWEAAVSEALSGALESIPPVPPKELAALTAKRAAENDASSTLLPLEFGKRYRDKFYDGLWMRGIGATVVAYLIGLAIYFSWAGVAWWRASTVEKQVTALNLTYTNALQLKARYDVLKEREDLKFAALDCWKLVAETQPEGLTLEGFSFNDGERLTLNGSARQETVSAMLDFNTDLKKAKLDGPDQQDRRMFKQASETPTYRVDQHGNAIWNFSLELQRAEVVK